MARPTGAATEFRVLGPVEVVRDGQTVRLGGRRQRALLALLLLEPSRPVSSDRLIDELWSGNPPAGAERTLRVYVSRLRSSLGQEAISPRPPGYLLDIEPDRLDVHRFQQLLQEGREALARNAAGLAADRLRAALDLWRGDALADVADGGALAREARRLDELRLTCVEERIEAELALGLHAELAPELDRLVTEEPLRERLWRQLVVALYRSERQADALAAYRRAQSLLADELGLEPSRELRALERAVLRHEIVDASPAQERHGGTVEGFGAATVVTGITQDHSVAPCGPGSWTNAATRRIVVDGDVLVLRELSVACPGPSAPVITGTYEVDGASSTGVFAGLG